VRKRRMNRRRNTSLTVTTRRIMRERKTPMLSPPLLEYKSQAASPAIEIVIECACRKIPFY
jgi:hypothetical protein